MATVPKRASVHDAQAALNRAADHLTVWQAGSHAEHLRAGHNALTTIDEALRALHGARAELVGELRAEQDATAARVDAFLAGTRTQRAAAVAQLRTLGGAA
jgi:hypothetical protein